MEKKFYTTGELGKIIGVSRITVYKWIIDKKIEGVRLPGGRWVILKKEVERIMKERKLLGYETEKEVKILIGDDNVDISNSLKEFLERRNTNFRIITAYNGFEVGKYLYSFKPEILILDIFMPGINGFEVLNIIKNDPNLKNIVIIVITGHPEEENIKKAKEEGADYIFIKPFDYKEIEKTIKNIVQI
ncbi:MAG TPA: response regulator [bacterium]|nr:response regulator [bacterium]HOM26456.1 response regulator [bacterium]